MKKALCAAAFSFLTTSNLFASGVDLVVYYGSRYVGMGGQHVALTGDAYTIFYNPGALAGVPGSSFAIDSTNLLYEYGAPLGGADQQRKSEFTIAPLFFIGGTYQLGKYLYFGLASYPTALQGGKFKNVTLASDLTDRNYGSKLVRIELSPTMAVKFSDYFGLGISWRPAYNKYEKYAGVFGAASTYTQMDGWDWDGFKFGAHLNNLSGLSIGVTFRPENEIELNGHTDIDYTAGLAPDAAAVPSYQRFTIPAQLQVGVAYEWTPRFTTALTFEQTYNEAINYDTTVVGGTPTPIPLHDKTTEALHVGGEYVFPFGGEKSISALAGFVYETAASRKSNPAAALPPAGEYYGGTIGSQFKFTKRQSIGLGLSYGEIESYSSTGELDTDPNYLGRSFQGKYTVDIMVTTLDYEFKF